MDKEFFEKRAQEIKNEMEVLKAYYAKLEGHLAECMNCLQKIIEVANNEPNQGEINGEVNNEGAQPAA